MTVNFNVDPYYDDYDEDKGFHRVLFKPGVAVQARELTQLQTILQNQISRFGRSIFKEGAMVIPGQASVDTNVIAIRLQPTSTNLSTLFDLGNTIITSSTSGVQAVVIKGINAEGNDPPTIIARYLTAGTNGSTKTFSTSETITINGSSTTLTTATSNALTSSSIASIEEGVYFALNNFVKVSAQTIVLDKYGSTPTYRIGLAVSEDFITEIDDPSLNDNSIGSYNANAPGADRYKITLTLDKLDITSTLDQDFIELIRVTNGVVNKLVNRTEYSELERTLARRTYDESGNYTVTPFRLQVREHRDNNRGNWAVSTVYEVGDIVYSNSKYYTAIVAGTSGGTGPSHTSGSATDGSVTWVYSETPKFNLGVYSSSAGGDSSKLAIGLEPGKAYVKGYEIEKIATEYIPISKARTSQTVSSAIIPTTVGNYVTVSNVYYSDTTNFQVIQFPQATLYDRFTSTPGSGSGNIVGTARVRDLLYDSGNAATKSGVFKLSLFDISLVPGKTFNRNVKQFQVGPTAFTADVSPTYVQLSGTVNAASSTSVTGSGTKFTSELVVGDYIYTNYPGTSTRRVTAIANDYSLTVDSAITATDSLIYRADALLQDAENEALLFNLPNQAIKDITSAQYSVTYQWSQAAVAGTVTITLAAGFASNPSALVSDYVILNATKGNTETAASVSYPAGQIVFTGLNGTDMYTVIGPAVKTLSPKTKTLTSATLTITDSNVFSAAEISLGKADVLRVDSIRMQGNSVNIIDWFTLDNGQKTTHYDVGKIIRKQNYPAPTSNVTIGFTYFTHGSGDYFAGNSYATYGIVPTFYNDGYTSFLTDILDFRPRKGDDNQSFTSTGAGLTGIPRRGYQSTFGYSYYLGRKDKIAIDSTGNVFAVSGAPAITPAEPNDPAQGMVLYKLNLTPYTRTNMPPDVTFEYIDNKRYTMRDIGALEKRINSIEYYTALSLLETDTKNLSIIDSATKLDRFKNGFIVDNFEGHGVGDVLQPDYRCAVDMQNNQLRPMSYFDNINLVEQNTTDAQRVTSKYQKTGDTISLRYTNTALVDQPYASREENVNPFALAFFNGTVQLTPFSDEWFETQRKPDVIINDDGAFNTLVARLDSEGVLGTVWNSWQTQWSGVTGQSVGTATSEDVAMGFAEGATLLRTAIQTGQARTGIRTTVVGRVDTRQIDDRTLSVAAIPYIRARNLGFVARGMKPKTNLYAYFDNANVTTYITPAVRIPVTSVVGNFDYLINADIYGSPAIRGPRGVNNAPDMAFNRGDVVYPSSSTEATSANTAVVSFVEVDSSGSTYLHLVNIKGNILTGTGITGSLSGATATVSDNVNASAAVQGSVLTTNAAGDVAGIFAIPNTDSLRFRTGVREFVLTDSATNGSDFTTKSRTRYSATGVLETKQATFLSTRIADVIRETVTDTRTISETVTGYFDPLAQTFFVDKNNGCFLTKVDLYFSTKDTTLPVTIEIRDVVNGYPGKKVLPFSRTILTPDKVNVSTDASVATTFTFSNPVYVQGNQEYCIVILSDSTNYRVWISQLGETNVGTDRLISAQPYAGVLFKSQNASTWTADQLQDLKFTLYRAQFDTANSDSTLTLLNDSVPPVTLPANPLKIRNGSRVVTVLHPNHSMPSGSNVTLSGFTTATSNINVGDINKSFGIGNVLLDSYTITLTNATTATSLVGGTAMKATRDVTLNTIQPIIAYQTFPPTSIAFSAYTSATTLSATRSASAVSIIPNQNNNFLVPQAIKSDNNQAGTGAADKSFAITAVMSTTDDAVSPIIDMNRVSVIAVSNRIDNSTATSANFAHDTKTIVNGNTAIAFSGNTMFTTNMVTANLLIGIDAGKTITITGAANPTNNANVVVSSVTRSATSTNVICYYSFTTEAAAANVIVTMKDNFIDERAFANGSAASKYITRQVNLQYPSTYLRVLFSGSVPDVADIDVYYRSGTSTLSTTNWVQMSPVSNISILKTNDDTVFNDIAYEATGINPFTTVAVKLVLRSTNTSLVPKVKDLRVIACP